jgi:hypothetical protein
MQREILYSYRYRWNLGLEFHFSAVSINLSVDWKPAFNLVGYSGFWADGGSILRPIYILEFGSGIFFFTSG